MSATNEQIEECFNIFDMKKNGYLEKDQLGVVLRALGKNPTEKELKEILDEIGSDKIDLAKVKTLYRAKKLRSAQDMDREMRNAFAALDRDGRGIIQETELRQILGNLGDALTSQEANDAGEVDYNAFVTTLVSAYPTGDRL